MNDPLTLEDHPHEPIVCTGNLQGKELIYLPRRAVTVARQGRACRLVFGSNEMSYVFPIMGHQCGSRMGFIPFAILEPHQARAETNHGQSLERLRERGGLSPDEAICIIKNQPLNFSTFVMPKDRDARKRFYEESWAELQAMVQMLEAKPG
jgi:hypothetical protein